MAKNITLLGASYSDVPAVNLPQTGGGTARFDDCSVTTATASDVAQGKVFVASDGTVTTGTASGGGGADVPTFTAVWTDDYSSIVSVTCDKTFEECEDILETAGFASVVDNIQSGTSEMLGTATSTGGDGSSLRYTVYFGGVYPAYDIVYYSNGTISAVSPSQMVETLNATANGTYYPQGGIITEVNVNVPQPSGTKSISISANGTTTEDVTNYANAQITVAVPQPSGSISITQNGTHDVTNYASAVVNVSGGGSSAWTKIAETSYQVSTTSTTNATVAEWSTGHSELWTSGKWVYIKVRDTAGKRAGYFYGSDQFFYNINIVNGNTAVSTGTALRIITRYGTDGKFAVYAATSTTGYGVYVDSVTSAGKLRVRRRYNATNSLTIDGTYKVEVYLLDPVVPIFE